uniref:Fibronectin type-III domain-containing protein n=1 Tax=Aplanochytrium stocchinoi TaxID=215587 RepID=A0A7S3UZC4_9STRA|mmetsp:Transcript_1800/g.2304  ORF Transcript_1800/g.2304 Transcript_1800/m.2304 type:complete len:109 (+) Transcript_1800:341-667(+)|eukprot:CAMPEP_0204831290 /NCGR_PEP_ID=MMETSP1346-20131115/10326_1 /ASSEMBLY_ACC=CAM_ASM_000771 /TAXON_ID=215587 /ORGANISM="Aplanochytrium stocchinoi, Strain GSBS06" /LENGTH=108 /DNA_ID=CAMNT_0051962219 /DNA_START=271 /DNA_END=597 /DNA_ORIENTATION=+
MSAPSPKPPVLTNPTEFSVDIAWEAYEGAKGYKIIERQIPNTWDECKIHEFPADKINITLQRLEPTQTYQFKVVAILENGESPASQESTIDTQVTSCTPKSEKNCTIV